MSSSPFAVNPTPRSPFSNPETSSPKPSSPTTKQPPEPTEPPEPLTRLDSSLESSLLAESQALKATATTSFTTGDSTSALDFYTRALAPLPTYLSYDLAVLHANIAACHLRLEQWKEANTAATKALEELAVVDPVPGAPAPDTKGDNSRAPESQSTEEQDRVLEIDDDLETRLEILASRRQTLSDVQKLRVKALLRRAKARSELGTWADLQGALEDYSTLAKKTELSATDRRTAQTALRGLPGRLEEAKTKEMADMMGKLKQLGNGFLKPFGLSTENFNFVKDENTGGYSMNFNQ